MKNHCIQNCGMFTLPKKIEPDGGRSERTAEFTRKSGHCGQWPRSRSTSSSPDPSRSTHYQDSRTPKIIPAWSEIPRFPSNCIGVRLLGLSSDSSERWARSDSSDRAHLLFRERRTKLAINYQLEMRCSIWWFINALPKKIKMVYPC